MPTLNTYRYAIGVTIEGLGNDTTKAEGYAFGYGTSSVTLSGYEWLAGSLTRIPQSIDTTVNPMTGDISVSAFTFEMSADDTTAKALLWQERDNTLILGAALTASATTVNITNLNGSGVNSKAGDVIWVGDEAILLGTSAGAGSYTSCTRDYYGTSAQAHIEGSRVYTDNPYLRFRQVHVILYDRDADSSRVIWRGYIDDIDTNDTGTTIQVACLELISSLNEAVVNREAQNLARIGTASSVFTNSGALSSINVETDNRVRKPDTSTAWVQIDDALFNCLYSGTRFYNPSKARYGSEVEVDEEEKDAEEAYEVFVVGPDVNGVSTPSTDSLTRPFHPLEIALALLTSTYADTVNVGAQAWDALGGNWGLQVPLDYIDLTSWQNAIEGDPDLRIERLILGWDGEPVDVFDVITNKLLKPYGYFLGTDTEGRLNVSRFELFDVQSEGTAADVSPLPTTLKWNSARSNAVQQVVAEVGETPWRDPDKLTILARDGSRTDSLRQGIFGEKRAFEYDLSTQIDERKVRPAMLERINLGFFSMPRVTIVVDDYNIDSLDFDMGAIVNISELDIQSAWFINSDGNRVQASATSEFIGQIISRRLNLENMTYTLTLLLTNYSLGGVGIRWRAPSARVVSVTDNGSTYDITVQQNFYHANAADASFFTVGDEVQWVGPDFSTPVDLGEIPGGGISGNVITTPSGTSAPSEGDILRLRNYDGYSNSAVVSGTTNPYAFLADTDNTLGGSEDDGNRYG